MTFDPESSVVLPAEPTTQSWHEKFVVKKFWSTRSEVKLYSHQLGGHSIVM